MSGPATARQAAGVLGVQQVKLHKGGVAGPHPRPYNRPLRKRIEHVVNLPIELGLAQPVRATGHQALVQRIWIPPAAGDTAAGIRHVQASQAVEQRSQRGGEGRDVIRVFEVEHAVGEVPSNGFGCAPLLVERVVVRVAESWHHPLARQVHHRIEVDGPPPLKQAVHYVKRAGPKPPPIKLLPVPQGQHPAAGVGT